MGETVFPLCCLTWGQTMVEVMKIMVTFFKRSHACTAALSASNAAAGDCWPMPLLETPGHWWACLDQFLVGSLFLSPRSWCFHELSDSQAGFRKRQKNQRSNCQHPLDHWNSREFQKNIYFCFIDYAKIFDSVDHNKLENWETILKEILKQTERNGNTRSPDLPI